MYSTKTKKLPTQKEVEEIDKVCEKMIPDKRVGSHSNPWSALWILNCIVYSAVIGWIIISGIKPLRTDITRMDNRRGTWKQPKWLIELDDEILQLRRPISQCCAERERLWYSRRLTRKSKRNRKKIYEECGPISVRSLTNTIEKNKAKLKKLSAKRKRKLKKQSSQIWNEKFFDDQKKVYTEFRTLIEEDKENIKPVFKERKEVKRNYFQDTGEVIDFWTKLWSIENEGNDNPEWHILRKLSAKL